MFNKHSHKGALDMVLTPSTYLSPYYFNSGNSSRCLQIPHPWDILLINHGHVPLKDGWYFQGWCNSSECNILHREEPYVFLFFSPEGETVWFHISRNLADRLIFRNEQILIG